MNLQGRTVHSLCALHVILGMGRMKQVSGIWALAREKSSCAA